MGRGKRQQSASRGPIALSDVSDGSARSRLPDALRVPEQDLLLLLAWSFVTDPDSGRSALPPEGAVGIVTAERRDDEEMACLDVDGKHYMCYPAVSLFELRARLRDGLRGVVTAVDRDQSRFVVRLALPPEA